MVGQIILSSKLADKMKLDSRPFIVVRVGVRMVKTNLEIKPDYPLPFSLSTELAQALFIKPGNVLQIRYDQEDDLLHIGPTIGILTTSLPNRAACSPSSLQAELIYLSKIARSMKAQVYVFTPNSIDWENKSTRGYIYKPTSNRLGIWESFIYPLPDVVYDRIPSRSSEARNLIKTTKSRLMSLAFLEYFNPSFFNKWRVYQMLNANADLQSYLPETRLLNLANLEVMLAKYPVLYLKPANGSLGRGIIKVTRIEIGKINYTLYGQERQHGRADSPADLLKRTQSRHKKKAYIVQQGIDFIKYQDSAFDIRIIFQKNGEGQWKISKKFVRLAPQGSSISNLSSGGSVEVSKIVLNNLFKQNKTLIAAKNNEMKKLCEDVAGSLEKANQSILGELGLDIGIDKRGRLWLIEVNSKPRKTTETEMSQNIVHNTFSRPLEYGAFLAGFKPRK